MLILALELTGDKVAYVRILPAEPRLTHISDCPSFCFYPVQGRLLVPVVMTVVSDEYEKMA